MYDYDALEALHFAVDLGSFSLAAQKLGLTQAAVSLRIKKLESTLGRSLLQKRTPPIISQHGKELLLHYVKVKLLENELDKNFNEAITFPVAINAESMDSWFFKSISQIKKSYKKIIFDIKVSDQDQSLAMLNNSEVLACISSKKASEHIFKNYYLGEFNYSFYKAPHVKSQKFNAEFPVCKYSKDDILHRYFIKKTNVAEYILPSTTALLNACLEGFGAAVLPEYIAQPHLKKKRLVEIIPSKKYQQKLYWCCIHSKSSFLNNLSKQLCIDFDSFNKKQSA